MTDVITLDTNWASIQAFEMLHCALKYTPRTPRHSIILSLMAQAGHARRYCAQDFPDAGPEASAGAGRAQSCARHDHAARPRLCGRLRRLAAQQAGTCSQLVCNQRLSEPDSCILMAD